LSIFKEYHFSGNVEFNDIGIFQSLKLRNNEENLSNFSQTKFHSKYFGLFWVVNSTKNLPFQSWSLDIACEGPCTKASRAEYC